MPRVARIVLPDHPHHVIQRGHNRTPVFVKAADFIFYLDTLSEWKETLGCRVYAFCLMTNHVHLIINPGESAENLALLMKRVAGRYTCYINRVEHRSGTVWNGRYKSSPIETDRYLMACSRYIELNPVRARMVRAPQDYRWSSYGHKIGRSRFTWLDEDPLYANLGTLRSERESRYREWVASTVPEGEWELIRLAVQRGQLSGSQRFQENIERRLGHRVESRGPGRPAYTPSNTEK
jgi:putative transposase